MYVPTLILPGIGNSDHAHWQTLWESANAECVRVQQRDWDNPVCHEWVDTLEQAVAKIREGPVLVAHSLGVSLPRALGGTYQPQR